MDLLSIIHFFKKPFKDKNIFKLILICSARNWLKLEFHKKYPSFVDLLSLMHFFKKPFKDKNIFKFILICSARNWLKLEFHKKLSKIYKNYRKTNCSILYSDNHFLIFTFMKIHFRIKKLSLNLFRFGRTRISLSEPIFRGFVFVAPTFLETKKAIGENWYFQEFIEIK